MDGEVTTRDATRVPAATGMTVGADTTAAFETTADPDTKVVATTVAVEALDAVHTTVATDATGATDRRAVADGTADTDTVADATDAMAAADKMATAEMTTEKATAEEKAAPSRTSCCLCPQCGFAVNVHGVTATARADATGNADALLAQARQQIQTLEAQVEMLDQKAAAAINRWADYENELAQLRRKLTAASGAGDARSSLTLVPPRPPPKTPTTTVTPAPTSPTRTSFLPMGAASRLSALLGPRTAKSIPNLRVVAAAPIAENPLPPLPTAMPTPPPSATNGGYDYMSAGTSPGPSSTVVSPAPQTPQSSFPFGARAQTPIQQLQQQQSAPDGSPSTKELLDALTHEQKLRRAAEGRLQDTSREVEELSVSLFEQANEMVAEERRARARLEARVAVLEQRDTEKKRRLERLEQAMGRIERLRAMLGDAADAVAPRPTAPSALSVPATA